MSNGSASVAVNNGTERQRNICAVGSDCNLSDRAVREWWGTKVSAVVTV